MFRLGRMLQLPQLPPADAGSASFEASGFTPSFADVLVLKAMLQKAGRLPLELVDDIVDFAEYWPHSTMDVDYGSPIVCSNNNNKFLIRSPPLGLVKPPYPDDLDTYKHSPLTPRPLKREYTPDEVHAWLAAAAAGSVRPVEHPCRKIVFTLQSEDQGWGGPAGRSHTYEGSYSWFDVGLERFDAEAAGPTSKAAGKAAEGAATVESAAGPSTTSPSGEVPPLSSLRSVIPRVEKIEPDDNNNNTPAPSQTTIVEQLVPHHVPTHHPMGRPGHRPLTRHPVPRSMPVQNLTTIQTPQSGPSTGPSTGQAAQIHRPVHLPGQQRISLPVEGPLPGLRPTLPGPTAPAPIPARGGGGPSDPGSPGGPGGPGDDPSPRYKFHHNLNPSNDALQHNRVAKRGLFTHRVEWAWTDRQGPGEGPELFLRGRGPSTGNGEYVRSLRAGDVVTLWAKARYPGWANRVKRVRVEVYWAV